VVTKARTKGAKRRDRRHRKNAITLPGGESVSQPATQGRRDTEAPASEVALQARVRRIGCTAQEARDVLVADDMGLAIRAVAQGDRTRRDLLGVWNSLLTAWQAYARSLPIVTSPQGATLPMLPETLEVDPTLRVDLRSQDERDIAARDRWLEALAQLMALPPDQRHSLRGHLQGYGARVWDPDTRRATPAGEAAVLGLAALHRTRS
jgi:hypothetical protein